MSYQAVMSGIRGRYVSVATLTCLMIVSIATEVRAQGRDGDQRKFCVLLAVPTKNVDDLPNLQLPNLDDIAGRVFRLQQRLGRLVRRVLDGDLLRHGERVRRRVRLGRDTVGGDSPQWHDR